MIENSPQEQEFIEPDKKGQLRFESDGELLFGKATIKGATRTEDGNYDIDMELSESIRTDRGALVDLEDRREFSQHPNEFSFGDLSSLESLSASISESISDSSKEGIESRYSVSSNNQSGGLSESYNMVDSELEGEIQERVKEYVDSTVHAPLLLGTSLILALVGVLISIDGSPLGVAIIATSLFGYYNWRKKKSKYGLTARDVL